jgi:hypothetical protein
MTLHSMTGPRAGAAAPALADNRRAISVASTTLLLVALAVVLFTALRSPLKDDIAWLLYVARRWLAGRELYVDVIEVNPPLIIWISAIPIRIAGWMNTRPETIAVPFFISAVLGCGGWAACLLRGYSGLFADRLPAFAALGTVLVVVPGMDLGQREHLLMAAILPYLVLYACRLDGRRLHWAAALAAGVLAGFGCALKPPYVAAFVVLECLALLRGPRLQGWGLHGWSLRGWGLRGAPFWVMPLAAAGTLAGYGALVLLTCPNYLHRAVPLALALYGATDVPFLQLLGDSLRLLFGEAVAVLLWWWSRRWLPERNLMLTLVVFALASTVVCFVDGKDWFYHRLPATIATILALLLWIGSTLAHRRSMPLGKQRSFLLAAAVVVVVALAVASYQRLQPEVEMAVQPDHSTVARLEQIVREQHARRYIAFSEWIALGFPVVNNTGVVWTSRFDSMWALKGELWRVKFDPSAEQKFPVRHWVARDFIAGCPDLAVVDLREGVNYIAVLSASDPDFARAWAHYRRIDAFDGLEVYRHDEAGCAGLPPT